MSASEGCETVESVSYDRFMYSIVKWMHGRAVSVFVSGDYFSPGWKIYTVKFREFIFLLFYCFCRAGTDNSAFVQHFGAKGDRDPSNYQCHKQV